MWLVKMNNRLRQLLLLVSMLVLLSISYITVSSTGYDPFSVEPPEGQNITETEGEAPGSVNSSSVNTTEEKGVIGKVVAGYRLLFRDVNKGFDAVSGE